METGNNVVKAKRGGGGSGWTMAKGVKRIRDICSSVKIKN